jgi:hypothetical protein
MGLASGRAENPRRKICAVVQVVIAFQKVLGFGPLRDAKIPATAATCSDRLQVHRQVARAIIG